MGQKKVSGQLNKVVRSLLEQEKIVHTIPEKPQSRLQKYRLTDKGIATISGHTTTGSCLGSRSLFEQHRLALQGLMDDLIEPNPLSGGF